MVDLTLEIDKMLATLLRECGPDTVILLIGSAAREKWSENSDIDFLVLAEKAPALRARVPGFHVQLNSYAGFFNRLCRGEDFESWSVRYGKVLHDAGWWATLIESDCVKIWPKWQTKVVHGFRRLILASSLLETGDLQAAREELMYALGHAGRGLLLKAAVFPLSRPELAAQLKELGYPNLANLHEKLRNNDSVSESLLRQAELYAKKLLTNTDKETYKSCSDESRKRKRQKQKLRGAIERC